MQLVTVFERVAAETIKGVEKVAIKEIAETASMSVEELPKFGKLSAEFEDEHIALGKLNTTEGVKDLRLGSSNVELFCDELMLRKVTNEGKLPLHISTINEELEGRIHFNTNLEFKKQMSMLNEEVFHRIETPSEFDESYDVKEGGGSYKNVRRFVEVNEHENKEVHHMPSDWSSPLERNDGPCIEMDRDDHRETASYGRSLEAQEYRELQKELIEQDDFRGALQMDIDDIHEKFGDKYDMQIKEMLDYVNKLEQEGKI